MEDTARGGVGVLAAWALLIGGLLLRLWDASTEALLSLGAGRPAAAR